MTASPEAALAAFRRDLEAAGLNLHGCLPIGRYDALVPPAWSARSLLPAAKSAVVLAAGGRRFFEAFSVSAEARQPDDPVDAFTRRTAMDAARRLGGRAVFAFERRAGAFADFVALARAAGLGADSRLGLLLHPVYGPWMSIRAVVLTPCVLPATPALAGFDPCGDCAAPCASACPAAAPRPQGFDVVRCAATRGVTPACRDRCDARRACVVGPEHRYAEAAERHHMRSLPGP